MRFVMESAKETDLANLMWSEKYRPKKLKEVVDQKEIIKGISNLIKSPDIPHMLFAGPAGVGKTTTAALHCNGAPRRRVEEEHART